MKVISVWQPYATLIVKGLKIFETRSWAAPRSLIGHRIGIASTKNILPAQRQACSEEDFVHWYERTELPAWDELPRGFLLGTVLLHSVEHITEEFLDDITDEEKSFGWFDVGGYAWRLRYPQLFEHPIPIQGKQGIYDYYGFDPNRQNIQDQRRAHGQA